ncbi:hypothetical protein LSH36_709g01040 [Paralvinella palmiformis]|uniref:Apple domain-containing protein n=1 Tax=Paralvinella palmiformis TaxID=53620 RepID=A0AAD9J1V3_9ANNE|nr:hypothetical protein LSH36_709g01040 [Paralvinella palmiformis]
MRRFNLKYNGLEEFPNFDNNTQLQLISLNGNALRSVPSNLLDNLVNLAYLNLKDNELSSFPDSPGLESLTYITLSRNKFTEFPEFRNVGRKLEAFYLSRNEITSVTEERFTYIRSVKYLSLMYNRISGKVPDFRMLEMLNHLDLSGNTFNGFDARMVDGFQNLVSVKLNMNSIKNIAGTFHLNNRTLQKSIMINLGDNPINCDCTAKWLKQAQTDESPIITSATCATPTNLFNRKLSELNITQLSCDTVSRNFYATKLESVNSLPLYKINGTYHVLTVTRCLQICHDQGDCLLFAYRRRQNNCVLTSTIATDKARGPPWNSSDIEWFVMY